MKVQLPKNISPYALDCLQVLKNSGIGQFVVLGGAFGLFHYHEYRKTKDIDAWWSDQATEKIKIEIIKLIEETLSRHGQVEIRRFGDVVSLELMKDLKIIFSFQIANRSARIDYPNESPWAPVMLDSVHDLVASKMSALIERGIPRDFIDIHEICTSHLVSIQQCWEYWKKREIKRGVLQVDQYQACEAVLLHLSRIERMRPLDTIEDEQEKKKASDTRKWFKNIFCKDLHELD